MRDNSIVLTSEIEKNGSRARRVSRISRTTPWNAFGLDTGVAYPFCVDFSRQQIVGQDRHAGTLPMVPPLATDFAKRGFVFVANLNEEQDRGGKKNK